MKPGKALKPRWAWGDDFGGESKLPSPPRGVTMWLYYHGDMMDVSKCQECGHSEDLDERQVVKTNQLKALEEIAKIDSKYL